MIAYKLLKQRKDGTLGPLFINCVQRIPLGVWLPAEAHRRKSYSFRPGWHTLLQPVAPHLKEEGRVWAEVEIEDFAYFERPIAQGSTWALANRMKVLRLL